MAAFGERVGGARVSTGTSVGPNELDSWSLIQTMSLEIGIEGFPGAPHSWAGFVLAAGLLQG